MKNFIKDQNSFFICKECELSFKNFRSLTVHISKKHNTKEYYDKWLIEPNEGKCKVCHSNVKFYSLQKGYAKHCSQSCINIDKYGTTSFFKTDEFKLKRKNTLIKKYGVSEPLQLDMFLEKRKTTNLQKYGFETPKLHKDVNEKYKQTCLNRYGVENIMHSDRSFNKMQNNSRTKRKFRNTNIWYQGSYELDFLEKYYDKYPDIVRGPSIKYKYKGKNKVYYSDFFIPSLNLVIECKSTYYYNLHKEINKFKEKYTKKSGFNYLLIIDKKDVTNVL